MEYPNQRKVKKLIANSLSRCILPRTTGSGSKAQKHRKKMIEKRKWKEFYDSIMDCVASGEYETHIEYVGEEKLLDGNIDNSNDCIIDSQDIPYELRITELGK